MQIEMTKAEILLTLQVLNQRRSDHMSARRQIEGVGEHDGRAEEWDGEYEQRGERIVALDPIITKLRAANDALKPSLEEAFPGMTFED